jgi:hypothetical protein
LIKNGDPPADNSTLLDSADNASICNPRLSGANGQETAQDEILQGLPDRKLVCDGEGRASTPQMAV